VTQVTEISGAMGKLLLGIRVAALLLAAAVPARAQSTIEECKAQIDHIQSNLDAIAQRSAAISAATNVSLWEINSSLYATGQ
jgi:hypothetical protein